MPETPDRTPFSSFLLDVNDGTFHAELTDALHDLLEAVQARGKSGTMTLKLKFVPKTHDQVIVAHDVVTKPPEERPIAVFFLDDDGNPSRHHPRQRSFDQLRDEIDSTPADTRSI